MAPHLGLAKNKENDPDEIGNRDVGRGINFYSVEKEVALGRDLAREIEWQSRVIDDPLSSEYVNRLGQNLVRNSDVRLPVTIKLLDSEQIEAFGLPGGFLFVNAGLILTTETEAELAAAMAHEIGHIAARHATRQLTLATICDYASLGLVFIGGQIGYAAMEAARLALPVGVAKFSRTFESEADFLGLQYAYKAGYDPTAFIDFLGRLDSIKHRKPGVVARLISTHPATLRCSETIQQNIRRILRPQPEYVVKCRQHLGIR